MNQPNSKKEVAIGLLNSHNIAFIDGNSTNWATESTAYNIRVPAIPALVVYAKTARQVQDVVSVAVTAGLKLSARCGGHSYASLGHGGEDDHLVVDLTQMSSVVVDPTTHIATIGAGARLGHVARGLYEQGERAISHGSCPAVGISGHILHGGYGWISHSKGLALDWLIGADVVLTSGTKVHCSETDNADLFWALRGAGSNFGIVTSFELKTFSAPVLSIPFNVALNWESEEQKIEGIRALVDFAVSAPAELNMRLSAHHSGGHSFEGVYYGDVEELPAVLGPLLEKVGGGELHATPLTWLEGLEFYAERTSLAIPSPYLERANFYATSMTLTNLTGQSLADFVHYWHGRAIGFQPGGWFLQLDLHGGRNSAISAVPNSSCAYAHRDKAFLVQLYHYVDNEVPYPTKAISLMKGWVEATTQSLKDGDWGMYANYVDSELDGEKAQKLYFGENLKRLKDLKKEFDPTEVFCYPQSITPADSDAKSS